MRRSGTLDSDLAWIARKGVTKMKIVILGCGRVGALLANMFDRAGHDVTIIDKNPDAFGRLDPGYDGEKIIGMGMDEEVLQRAGLNSADAFIAVTNGDNTNVMAGQIAQRRFEVPRVIVRLYDPIRAQTYREFGLEVICTSLIGAGVVRDLLLGEPQKRIEDYLEMGQVVREIVPDIEGSAAPTSERS